MSSQDQPNYEQQETPTSEAASPNGPDTKILQNLAAQTGRSVEMLALAGDLNARNLEFTLSMIRTAMSGMEALARETVARSRRTSEQAAEALRGLSEVRSPQDLLSAQSSFLKASSESMIEHTIRTQDIAESTRKALANSCSSHLQDSFVGYTRVVPA
jgi:phasin family protein